MIVATLVVIGMQACQFKIKNDGKSKLFVLDPHSGRAVYISPNKFATIDPTLKGWVQYWKSEQLDFLVEYKPNKYHRKYRLTEKYCVADPKANELAFSDIERLSTNPTDRLTVQAFKLIKPMKHKNNHNH